MKKCIYFDGRVDGAAAAARAQADRDTVTRDASVFLQRDDSIEKFLAVLIPAGKDFDSLAERYAAAEAQVTRAEAPAEATPESPKSGAKARKE